MVERALDRLAGDLKVCPGIARPHNLLSSRPDWVGRLTQGTSANTLPDLLASLFSLCGHAHRLCAGLALQAARGRVEPMPDALQHSLQTGTLREHLRRISLDWPRQLAPSSHASSRFQALALRAIQTCPLSMSAPRTDREMALARLPLWLDQQLLGLPAAQWLEGWERDPRAWLAHWSATTAGWLPELLQASKVFADVAMTGTPALRVHASEPDLRVLAGQLGTVTAFSRQPQWQGRCAETGTWTRLNQDSPNAFDTPLLRLGARLAETVRLSLPDEARRCGAHWLQAGSVCIGANEGLAWVEMARGLLIHQVQLDGNSPDARILACHVVAPTEWNFHPQGAVAQWLETQPQTLTPDGQRQIVSLMTAYDPCVSFDIRSATYSKESLDA